MTGAFSSGKPRLMDLGDQDSPKTAPKIAQDRTQDRIERTQGSPILGAHTTNPMSVRSNQLSAMDRLKSMVAAKIASPIKKPDLGLAKMDNLAPKTAPKIEPPKGEFKLGVRPAPTGPTAHEIMTKPEHQKSLQDIVQQHETAMPGRSLKAPHLMSMWNAKHPDKPLNEARARTVVAKVKAARDDYVQKQVSNYMRQGAAKALKK